MKIDQCQVNIKDRIYEAIAEFVGSHDYEQSVIHLSSTDYGLLHFEATSTEVGRSFLIGDYGTDMRFCDLEVKMRFDDRGDIVIA